MENLHDALVEEIARCSEALGIYRGLPNGAGNLAASLIEAEIKEAKEVLAEMDPIKMMQAYQALKEVKL